MVYIDDRAGSKSLVRYSPLDQTGELCRLDSADAMFPGNGPKGEVLIGIELKSILDFISSVSTGRLQATQIPAMLSTYDHSWLLIYGGFRPHRRTGQLLVERGTNWRKYELGKRPVPYTYVEAMLLDITMLGVHVRTVNNYGEAAQWIGVLHRWWSKPWAKHKGMRTFDRSQDLVLTPGLDQRTYVRAKIAATLPGVGFERGIAAAQHFTSVKAMVNATEQEWMEVAGVGKVVARAAVEAVK